MVSVVHSNFGQMDAIKRFAVQNKEVLFLGFLGACVIGTIVWKIRQPVEPPKGALVVDKVQQLDLEGLEKLFERKASPNAKDRHGTPVLIWVVVNSILLGSKAKKVFDCLIQRGADVNAVDGNGRSALHHAAMLSSDLSCFVEQLLANRAEVNQKDKLGKTPLGYANQGKIVNLLESYGGEGKEILIQTQRDRVLDELKTKIQGKADVSSVQNPEPQVKD